MIETEFKKRALALQRGIETATGESYNDLTEAVKTVVNKVEKYSIYNELTDISFVNNKTIERIDVYLDLPFFELSDTFKGCSALKYIKGINLSKCHTINQGFNGCGVEIIEEPLDLSSLTTNAYNRTFEYNALLKEVRIVPETIKVNCIFRGSNKLSDESIQSIINGLAYVETAQTLAFHATVKAKLTAEQLATITNKNWSVA